ncbi:MAG: MFS transporter, partial [SAR202 cluster bacterium]|nr:MFS transporter [SAR202 cluster bacterium]
PAIHSGITALIQPYSAYAFRPGPHRSVWLRNMYASGSVAYIALGAAVLAGFLSGTTAVVFTLLTALVFAITVGLADPHYMDLVAEAAPADLRGRFFGLRVIFLGLGGVVGGELAEWVLGAAAPPQNFGASLCVGGVLYVLCTQALRRFQDPPVPTPEPLPAGSFSRYLGGSLGPLALHPRFRGLLGSFVCFALAVAVFPFLANFVRDRLGAEAGVLGTLGGLVMAGNVVLAGPLGQACDRFGSRATLAGVLVCYGAALLLCVTLTDRFSLYAAYFLASIWMPGLFVPATKLVMELGAADEANPVSPAESTALMMAAMAPSRILGPVAAGFALDRVPPASVFLTGVALALVSVAILLAGGNWTGRPRHSQN